MEEKFHSVDQQQAEQLMKDAAVLAERWNAIVTRIQNADGKLKKKDREDISDLNKDIQATRERYSKLFLDPVQEALSKKEYKSLSEREADETKYKLASALTDAFISQILPADFIESITIEQPKKIKPFERKAFTGDLFPILSNKVLDVLPQIRNTDISIVDEITGIRRATVGEVTFEIANKPIKGSTSLAWGILGDKLMKAGMILFTRELPADNTVSFPLKEFASMAGYSVEVPEDATEQEKKRANEMLKYVRKEVQAKLTLMQSTTATKWGDKVRGQPKDYFRAILLAEQGIVRGQIIMRFDQKLADAIREKYALHYLPKSIMSIPNNKTTAYAIANAIWQHYSMRNNHQSGTANILSVKTLLSKTDLQRDEAFVRNRQSWDNRIREPFVNALEDLVKHDVLENYEFTRAKGIRVTDEEMLNIADYDTFENLYVKYSVRISPDFAEELGKRADTRKKVTSKKGSVTDAKKNRKK